jgi:hypothetical protein
MLTGAIDGFLTGFFMIDDSLGSAPDPSREANSTIDQVSETVKSTVHTIGDAIESGRKPGMPLSILSKIAREAPLGSLLVAFLLGVAIARRR